MLLDVHTHHINPSPYPYQSIYNVALPEFAPTANGLYSVGIHPWMVHTASQNTWETLLSVAQHPAVVAIGEAGIDRLATADITTQIVWFTRQIALSEELRKPLIIHCVRAYAELLSLHKQLRPTVAWVLHGFRGRAETALQLTDKGLYLSFGTHFQTAALKAVPRTKLLAESDESQTPIAAIVGTQAEALGISADELTYTLMENAQKIFFTHA